VKRTEEERRKEQQMTEGTSSQNIRVTLPIDNLYTMQPARYRAQLNNCCLSDSRCVVASNDYSGTVKKSRFLRLPFPLYPLSLSLAHPLFIPHSSYATVVGKGVYGLPNYATNLFQLCRVYQRKF